MRSSLVALEVATQAAELVLPFLDAVPPVYSELGRQCGKSVTSVPLNLAEGAGRTGRDAQKHFRIAYAESLEATTAVRLLRAVNALPADVAEQHQELQDRARRLTCGLRRGR